MSFLDIVLLVIVGFILIIVVNVADYVHQNVFVNGSARFNETLNASDYNAINNGWNTNKGFFNNSYAALMIVMGIAAVLMAAILAPHPAALAVWLLINIVTLFIYDGLNQTLNGFLLSNLNTGAMNTAVSFWQSGMPKLIIGLNILMAIALFGKRVME